MTSYSFEACFQGPGDTPTEHFNARSIIAPRNITYADYSLALALFTAFIDQNRSANVFLFKVATDPQRGPQ